MKKHFIILIALLSMKSVYCQPDPAETKSGSKVSIGTEIDVLPYISKGWYASPWLGINKVHLRIRPVFARVNVPGFFIDDHFNSNTLQVYALIVDYFFKPDYKGFWIAPGIEYWDAEVENKNGVTAQYDELVFTVGGGYVWKFWKNMYLNPWVACHLHVAGNRNIAVGEDVFHPAIFTPEASLKLGWYFPIETRAKQN